MSPLESRHRLPVAPARARTPVDRNLPRRLARGLALDPSYASPVAPWGFSQPRVDRFAWAVALASLGFGLSAPFALVLLVTG